MHNQNSYITDNQQNPTVPLTKEHQHHRTQTKQLKKKTITMMMRSPLLSKYV